MSARKLVFGAALLVAATLWFASPSYADHRTFVDGRRNFVDGSHFHGRHAFFDGGFYRPRSSFYLNIGVWPGYGYYSYYPRVYYPYYPPVYNDYVYTYPAYDPYLNPYYGYYGYYGVYQPPVGFYYGW
jgi:hypothetical protein